MPKVDQPPPDEIMEEVPKAGESSGAIENNPASWSREPSVEDMSRDQRAAFFKMPKAEQSAYLARIDDANAKATAYMAAQLAEHRRTHVFIESAESRADNEIRDAIAADERWEMRLAAERKAMEEQKEFLTRAVRELSAIIKEVAREEDLDSVPGWMIAAFELLPYVSAAYALFGVEIATRRDPNTDEVVGTRFKELTAAERAIHVTIGEMAVSKKLSMSAMKIVKKVMARALRSSTRYVAGAAKKAITQAV